MSQCMFIDEVLKESAILEATKRAHILDYDGPNEWEHIVYFLIKHFDPFGIDQLMVHSKTIEDVGKAELDAMQKIGSRGATLRKIIFANPGICGRVYNIPVIKTDHVERGYIFAVNKAQVSVAASGSYKFVCLDPEKGIKGIKYE